MLEKTGQADKALEIYRQIDMADPTYKDVREKIQLLSPVREEEEDKEAGASEGTASVRSFIKSGKIEPKYGFKLWFQILKSLQDAHAKGRAYGFLGPENILIDAQNNISFLKKTPSSVYLAPEKTKELELDVRADIFSMGVILYELLTGSLEGLGSARVMDVAHDVPEWLDEIVIKCIRKVREDRYQSIDQILEDIKDLSKAKKESEPDKG
jgi:serine/threonine protein kinase